MILKRDKNTLLTIIKESGLDPSLFAVENGPIAREEFLIIQLRDSPLRFAVREWDTFDEFGCRYTQFLPGLPLSGKKYYGDPETLYAQFKIWLKDAVEPYLNEVSIPDLWQMLEDTRSYVKHETEAPDYSESFSEEEKIHLRLSINEFRLLIVNNINPNKEELAAINDRLEYLSDAIDKRNKFDWKGIAIHTVITIIVTLSLNPEQSKQLFQLFKQVFSTIIYLLP